MTKYEEYTIGIVCAAGFEMSAVRYMLDREHTRPSTHPGDPNRYVLGELSGHNVVVACLPGTQGKGAAVIVATNMDRTFPCLGLRLLVGIGSGVPSTKHDIRLGDVVVSMPEGTYGGVVQYDPGKDTESGFVLKGFLQPLPSILRAAVEEMRSDHLLEPTQIDTAVSTMVQKGPDLAIYSRPSAALDRLFKPEYSHPPQQPDCSQCDAASQVSRTPRAAESAMIHYGLIASGDRMVKSAASRDAFGRAVGDILCFEMEAAGVMSEFPCLVIRGVSSYADSHKNDAWNHYAAAAAAGCAKELLSHVGANPTKKSWAVPMFGRRVELEGPGWQGFSGIYRSGSGVFLSNVT
ncbi:hypothetical protein GGTG_09537 [Gaeumannomyces tritici R3-111a-1]|uniref:Nucleoside phosphorylase domain-containing protein n=1 Tax=Gaeumannomyces tritici (strain R3-111a-1) TaxID=644352 RepID=J3P7P6_GAET3|nr:hypothetical protein GGTG_09537 [Gaeumannomyces tritici R3-111a-1]EJT72678.1 hypothetical protein GGTG_09537 [Gaeumannomyces tritici R3-111a-1]